MLSYRLHYSANVPNAYQYLPDTTNACGPNVATTILMPTGAGYARSDNSCDANGNIVKTQPAHADGAAAGGARRIRYDATNRPREIRDTSVAGSPMAQFTYAPDGRRVHEVLVERDYTIPNSAPVTRTRHVLQGQRGYQIELPDTSSGLTKAMFRHEIGDVSVVLRAPNAQSVREREVTFKTLDRLGSPLGITDKYGKFRQVSESGAVNEADTRLSFDAFGAARKPNFEPRNPPIEMPGRINLSPATRLGFTGHEHLDSLGLIHMNGRVYDYRLGRFLSVDPLIQFPANSQSLNPYSYIMNNPMAGTDPSGYKMRGRRTPFVSESCMGSEICEREQTFAGPVSDLRSTVRYGGAPRDTWNGWEANQAIRKAQNNARRVLEIGKILSSIVPEIMLAQVGDTPAGVTSANEYNEYLGEGNPRQSAQKVAETGKAIGEAGHDIIEPSLWDLIPWTRAWRLKRAKAAYDEVRNVGKGRRLGDEACCCFPAGTLVWTEDGPVRIENIKVGQRVYARNPLTDETALKPVTALIATKPKALYEVVVRGFGAELEQMLVTGDHPYWVGGEGWVRVDKLAPGMALSSLDSGDLHVEGVRLTNGVEATYNFTVADFHTYFAGPGKILVHNSCSCTDFVRVNANDPAANALAERIGGVSSVRFPGRFSDREFDVYSDMYVGQSKPANFKLGSAFRDQAKATFEAARELNRTPYFHFDGAPESAVLNKIQEYSERYQMHVVIDTDPLF